MNIILRQLSGQPQGGEFAAHVRPESPIGLTWTSATCDPNLRVADIADVSVFDTETTGVDTENARIVTCFIGEMGADGVISKSYEWLINPGVDIPEEAAAVHGISNEVAQRDGTDPKTALREIVDTLRRLRSNPLVAYNAPFDLALIDRESRRHLGEALFDDPEDIIVIDPLVLDKAVDKYRKGKRTLTVAAAYYGVELGEDAHEAKADATATGQVARKVLERLLGGTKNVQPRPDLTVGELSRLQAEWKAEQSASLQTYFHGIGKTDIFIDGSFPYAPYVEPAAK